MSPADDLLAFQWVDRDRGHAGYLLWASGWFAAAVVGVHGRALLQVVDLDAPRPPGPGDLDLRADGLWASVVPEEAERWTLGLEAFAVAFDDPEEAIRSGRGDLVPLGFDLEWEGPAGGVARVDGELLVGRDVIGFDEVAGCWSIGAPLPEARSGERVHWSAPIATTDDVVGLVVVGDDGPDGWRWAVAP